MVSEPDRIPTSMVERMASPADPIDAATTAAFSTWRKRHDAVGEYPSHRRRAAWPGQGHPPANLCAAEVSLSNRMMATSYHFGYGRNA